jgi:DNA-binding transcriptional ArsR family regulator
MLDQPARCVPSSCGDDGGKWREGLDDRRLTIDAAALILNYMVQYTKRLDRSFAALSDATRRGILKRLGRSDASISDLAESFEMTLTGMKKHVKVLEDAGLVTTEKVGRVRTCRLGPRRLKDETDWIEMYQEMLEDRFNRLGEFLERTKGGKS